MRPIPSAISMAALATAVFAATPATAQQEDFQAWEQLNVVLPVATGVRVTGEQIARTSDRQGGIYTTEYGVLVGVQIAKGIELGGGYRRVGFFNGNTGADEDRLRQQIVIARGRWAGRLRLDERESAVRDRDGHAVIVPGKPEASELILRVTSKDPDEVMPPPDSHKSLTTAQVDVLRRWIAEGAPYQKHWAFETPRRAALPAVRPVNHVLDDGDIVIRTRRLAGVSTALEANTDLGMPDLVVAYEADLLDPVTRFGWSVVVTGVATVIHDPRRLARVEGRLEPWVDSEMDVTLAIRPEIVTGMRLVAR